MIDSFTGPLTKSQRAFEAWYEQEYNYYFRRQRRGYRFDKNVFGWYEWEGVNSAYIVWLGANRWRDNFG